MTYLDDYNPDHEPDVRESRRGIDGIRIIAMAGAFALIAAPAVMTFTRLWRARQPQAVTERAIDKTLKDTFPASDPPASRYFDIPENRQ